MHLSIIPIEQQESSRKGNPLANSSGQQPATEYFVFGFPLSDRTWHRYAVRSVLPGELTQVPKDPSYEIRKLSDRVNDDPARQSEGLPATHAETLLALRTINQVLRFVAGHYAIRENPGCLQRSRQWANQRLGTESVTALFRSFVELFPPLEVQLARRTARDFLDVVDGSMDGHDQATLEMLLLFLNTSNPAAASAVHLFDDDELRRQASFVPFITGLEDYLEEFEPAGGEGGSLVHLLRGPMLASPDSLSGQIDFIRQNWSHLLPEDLILRLQFALDVLKEIDVRRAGEPGPPPVLEFGPGSPGWDETLPEPEAFSKDADWMSNVVLMAKSVYVWLDQLSKDYGHPVRTLADIPDQELDKLARWGITGLWLIGLWERSEASRLIKQYLGNPDAAASAYALRDYKIAEDLGGPNAYQNLADRAGQRGIRLASDMVPNHMGIDSRWVIEHPDWFLQAENPPFPAYDFTGGDLCDDPNVTVRIEDGYWDQRDASVVFQRVDNNSGHTRYIYHGNDGTSMPWNDTAQLNFLLPEVREAVTQVILDVARMFPIIRFDAAMTLAKKHYQRLWFPAPGDAGAIPSRAEHGMSKEEFNRVFPEEFWRQVVDRVAAEAPDTLLLAEAFWLMEGYFVRTLGMHRVYNSAFMNMLKMEDNAKYRQTIKNVLEFSPAVLQRFVNFMNNPDEKTAVEQFGRSDKYFGCALLLVTLPGLPMIGHGQIEGFTEKYGMEYRKACWDESVDQEMVTRHEREIFPLMRLRHLFSGSENFALFDFETGSGHVDENVFAYTNRSGGERALIIFNNCYEQTSGNVRHSSAVNTGSSEEPYLVRRSLAEALQLDDSPETWFIYKDHSDAMEYLESGSDLVHNGFHTHLGGYQSRALVNFRQISDEDGSWSALAQSLAGAGVPDMNLARRKMEIAPVLEELKLSLTPEILAGLETLPFSQDDQKETTPADSATILNPQWQEKLAKFKPGTGTRKELDTLIDELPGSRILQANHLADLLLELPGSWNNQRDIIQDGFHLHTSDAPLFLAEMADAMIQWAGHSHAGWSTVWLAEILATGEKSLQLMAAGETSWLSQTLSNRIVKKFLQVNRHQGLEYFNKESLQHLLDAMVFRAIQTNLVDNPANLLDARALLIEQANKTKYQTALLSRAIQE
jgi:glycosidase